MVGWGGGVGGGGGVRLGLGVDSGSLVSDLGNIAVIAVGGVLHVLDPEVGLEVSDAVRDENNSYGADQGATALSTNNCRGHYLPSGRATE